MLVSSALVTAACVAAAPAFAAKVVTRSRASGNGNGGGGRTPNGGRGGRGGGRKTGKSKTGKSKRGDSSDDDSSEHPDDADLRARVEEVVHQANDITREDEVPAIESRAAQPKRNDSSDEDDRKPSASSDASGNKKLSSDIDGDDNENKPLEYHASYIREKLDYINGFLARNKNKPLSTEDLKNILEVVDMLDELVGSYRMSKLRSELGGKIAATQAQVQMLIAANRRRTPRYTEINEAAAAVGRAAARGVEDGNNNSTCTDSEEDDRKPPASSSASSSVSGTKKSSTSNPDEDLVDTSNRAVRILNSYLANDATPRDVYVQLRHLMTALGGLINQRVEQIGPPNQTTRHALLTHLLTALSGTSATMMSNGVHLADDEAGTSARAVDATLESIQAELEALEERLVGYYAPFVTKKLDKMNGHLAEKDDKEVPLEELQSMLECLDGLDELVVEDYEPSILRSKLRQQIRAFQEQLRMRIESMATNRRNLDRRRTPTIAEEGTADTTESAAAAGCAAGVAAGRHAGKQAGRRAGAEAGKKHGRMALQQYVEANLNPLLEQLQRRLGGVEEATEITSPDIERIRQAQQVLAEGQRLFHEDINRRMDNVEQVQAQHDNEINQLQDNMANIQEGLANVQQDVANLQVHEPQQQQEEEQDEVVAVVSDDDDSEAHNEETEE